MFANTTIKEEIVDNSYEQNDKVFKCRYSDETLDKNGSPKKKIKIELQINDPRLLKHRNNSCIETKIEPKCEQEVDNDYNHNEFGPKIIPPFGPVIDKRSISLNERLILMKSLCSSENGMKTGTMSSPKPVIDNKAINGKQSSTLKKTYYENVLQEIFQWSPDWLQGSVGDKPPILKAEKLMNENGFKYDYSIDEYIAKHLPYIMRGLFMKMSDVFKNEAPSRSDHLILINDFRNTGPQRLNRGLVCYKLRDIRQNGQSMTRANDIITISLSVITGNLVTKKHYFGIISNQSMIEFNDLDHTSVKRYETLANTKLDYECTNYLLWDRLIILTKKALNSNILVEKLASISVLFNASFELRLIKNLLAGDNGCTKLMSNILSANANIHQFCEEELTDFQSVRKTLCANAIDMITKCNPMVYFKGINNLMAIDISDKAYRFEYLCHMAVEACKSPKTGKVRILVITSSYIMSCEWLKRLKTVGRRHKPWFIDGNRGWTRNGDVVRSVYDAAEKVCDSLRSKMKKLRQSDENFYSELTKRRQLYKDIKACHRSTSRSQSCHEHPQSSAFMIATDQLCDKGFKIVLNKSNVIIGTFYDVLNCDQLFNDESKPFDCCIIDDCHQLSDAYIMSIIHLGIYTMIVCGDSEHRLVNNDPIVTEYKYNISLFERIINKVL